MWDGPVNERAYAERDIYEQVSDEDGQVIGMISIARGKFFSIRLC